MNKQIQITVQLHGAYRQYSDDDHITVFINKGGTLAQLKKTIATELSKHCVENLLQISAFTNDTEVLTDDFKLNHDTTLAILPPICGG